MPVMVFVGQRLVFPGCGLYLHLAAGDGGAEFPSQLLPPGKGPSPELSPAEATNSWHGCWARCCFLPGAPLFLRSDPGTVRSARGLARRTWALTEEPSPAKAGRATGGEGSVPPRSRQSI